MYSICRCILRHLGVICPQKKRRVKRIGSTKSGGFLGPNVQIVMNNAACMEKFWEIYTGFAAERFLGYFCKTLPMVYAFFVGDLPEASANVHSLCRTRFGKNVSL